MAVTLDDLAKRAGVSVSTVSRVLNRQGPTHRISKKTEKLILEAAEKLNYRPNQLARGLRLRRTHTIGLIVPDISNPFFAYVTRSIQAVAHKFGYTLVVCDTDEHLELEIEHLNLLISKGVDGLIILPVGQEFHHIENIMRSGPPFVLVDRCFQGLNTSSVIVDNYQGACEAVEHLIACGHERIAIIQGLPQTFTNDARVRAYRDTLIKHAIGVREDFIVGNSFRRENGYIETKLLLQTKDPPTAIFATSDLITLGMLQALFEEKKKIPGDISVVSFDDIDFAPFLTTPLTVVAQPKESMGELAVKLLVDQLADQKKKETRTMVLKPRLIIRESVRRLVPTRLEAAV